MAKKKSTAKPPPEQLKKEEPKKEKSHLYVGLFDILPDDVDTDLDAMMEAVKEAIAPLKAEVESWDSEEMAYGLKKVKAKIVFPDSIIGGTEPIEQAIMGLDGQVQRAECTMSAIYR